MTLDEILDPQVRRRLATLARIANDSGMRRSSELPTPPRTPLSTSRPALQAPVSKAS